MASDSRGYYEVLGLKPGASISEVKNAYKRKQVELHPSGAFRRKMRESPEYKKLTDDEKAAKEKELDELVSKVNSAYTVLSNENTKNDYDNGSGEFSEFPNMGGFTGDFSGFSDFFSHFAGGGGGQKKQYKVKDTVTEIRLELKDVFLGKTSKFKIKVKKLCRNCDGKGASEVHKCGTCNGKGTVYINRRLGIMVTRSEVECSKCMGRGEIASGPICESCKGDRILHESEVLEVKIRPGIKDGETIVFKGKGNQHPGCINGDVVFKVTVLPNQKFHRVKNNLISTIDVDLLTALTGGVAYFEHIDGRRFSVNIKPFKNFQDCIVIYKEGLHDTEGKGDLYLKPNVLINKGLDRSKLSELIKPMVSKPYGEYQSISGNFGTMPEDKEYQEEDEQEYYSNFDGDIFKSFRFF